MRQEKRATLRWAAATMLLGGVVGLAGCGSSGSNSITGSGQINGRAEAPTAQVAQATGVRQRLAQLFALGTPVEAERVVSRRPVSGGTVTLARLSDQVTITRTTTDANGSFTLNGVTPGTTFEITVTAPGPQGQITLRSVVEADSTQTTATVNEATTVGAEAATLVTAEGSDDASAAQLAEEVTEEQETAETQDPAQVPDLSDPADVSEAATGHLVGNLDSKLQALFATPANTHTAWRALMATQVYAHVNLGLPTAVHLTRPEVLAFCDMTKAGKTFDFATLATTLQGAGVATTVSSDDVKNALATLKQQQKMSTVLSGIPDEGPVPPVVALLLSEQVQASNASGSGVVFAAQTQEQMAAYQQALVAVNTEAPAETTP